jgi:hypothetical protein
MYIHTQTHLPRNTVSRMFEGIISGAISKRLALFKMSNRTYVSGLYPNISVTDGILYLIRHGFDEPIEMIAKALSTHKIPKTAIYSKGDGCWGAVRISAKDISPVTKIPNYFEIFTEGFEVPYPFCVNQKIGKLGVEVRKESHISIITRLYPMAHRNWDLRANWWTLTSIPNWSAQ